MSAHKAMNREYYDPRDIGIVNASSSLQSIHTAGIGGVKAFQVVAFVPSAGCIIPADGSNPTHAGLVEGVAIQDIEEGGDGAVIKAGEVQNLEWDLDPGEIYFVGIGGTISKVPPETGFWQTVGVAKDSVTLAMNIGEAILVV